VDMNEKMLYKRAIAKWGKDSQVFMMFEEIAELILSICHSRRSNKIVFKCDLISEIADVEIMLNQMKILFDITNYEIDLQKIRKLERLEKRLEENKK